MRQNEARIKCKLYFVKTLLLIRIQKMSMSQLVSFEIQLAEINSKNKNHIEKTKYLLVEGNLELISQRK